MTKRTQYSKEFKLDAESLVFNQVYSLTDAVKGLSISVPNLSLWVKEHQPDEGGQAVRGHGKLTPDQEEYQAA